MARISLRTYNREIEGMIDGGRIDEAIAHCRHILQTFPKHIETYRLLGKAFLESQRYSDAADVLQRVLSAIPDDFVSHVGMSIIREDEGNLDEAIWHMERAYEVQPANPAIQEELRRLYGRRDGIEPPKVRLTRGSLARMYAKGDLYQQAIGELRAALAEDSQRLDLQSLLARVYLNAGQRVEAAEMGSGILRKLPYCIEANRIMVDVLVNTNRLEEAKPYQQRIQELDPYFAFVSTALPSLERVPDQSVSLEKLIYQPGEKTSQPAWAASLGVDLGQLTPGDEENLPDWLSSPTGEELQPGETPAVEPAASIWEGPVGKDQEPEEWQKALDEEKAEPAGEDLIPEWMKDAGWGPSTGAFDESKASAELEEEQEFPTFGVDAEAIAPAELPDWMKDLAPQGTSTETVEGEPAPAAEETGQDLAWLEEALDSKKNGQPVEEPAESATAGLDERLEEAGAVDELPEWLSDTTLNTVSSEDVPDWLREHQDQPAPQEMPLTESASELASGDVPDWLSEFKEAEPPEADDEAALAAELPDWLRDLGPAEAEPQSEEEQQQPETEIEPIPQEDEHVPGDGDELLEEGMGETAEVAVAGELPAEPETASELPETPLEEAATPAAEPMVNLDDEAAAFAWLESLAVKQGADEAILMTEEERQEQILRASTAVTQPVVTGKSAAGEAVQEENAEELEFEGAAAVFDLPTELSGADQAEPVQEEPEAGLADLPAWLVETPGAQVGSSDETVPMEVGPAGEEPEAELPDWLVETPKAEAAPLDETIPTRVESAEEELAVEAGREIPDWIKEMTGEQPAGAAVGADLPAEEETLFTEAGEPEGRAEADFDELPDWLREMAEEPVSLEGFDQPAETGATETAELAAEFGTIPDWLMEAAPEGAAGAAAAFDLPEEFVEEHAAAFEQLTESPEEAPDHGEEQPGIPEGEAEPAEIPDWLRAMAGEPPEVTTEEMPEPEQAEIPAWLQEAAATPAEPAETQPSRSALDIEEVPLAEADTKPVRVRAAMEGPVPEPEEATTGEISLDQEPEAEIFERPQEVGSAAEMEEAAGGAAAFEMPDWLTSIEETPASTGQEQAGAQAFEPAEWPLDEQVARETLAPSTEEAMPEPLAPVEAEIKQGEAAPELGEPEPPIEPAPTPGPITEPQIDLSDTDAAFAWLESLAVKQGADEALLLTPEERLETAPEWVLEAAKEDALAEEQALSGEPPAVVEAAGEEPATDEETPLAEAVVEPVLEAPVMDETPAIAEPVEPPPTTPVAGEAALDFADEVPVEPEGVPEPAAAAPAEPPAPTVDEIPELPDWLAAEPGEPGEIEEWTPPAEPVTAAQAAPVVRYNLNQASLVELERLPGIGFIQAQRIIDYREAHGPFNSVEGLLDVPGFSAGTLDLVRDRLLVDQPAPATAPVIELPAQPDLPPDLALARGALNSGRMDEAARRYSSLIKARQYLPEVIADLEEAIRQYPGDANLWQALGDAHMRANHLQDALNAYNRAEELLR